MQRSSRQRLDRYLVLDNDESRIRSIRQLSGLPPTFTTGLAPPDGPPLQTRYGALLIRLFNHHARQMGADLLTRSALRRQATDLAFKVGLLG